MFSRNGLRSTFPSPNAIGVRAYGAAIEERLRERRKDRLHLQELRRQELQKEEERKARDRQPIKATQSRSGEYGGQAQCRGQERDKKPVMNLREALALDSPYVSNRLFSADEPQYAPILMEEGDPSGRYEPMPMSLFDCILNEVLDMDRAARLIFDQKQRGDFDQAEYDDFVNSELAVHATPRFDYDDWSDLDDTQALWHNILATRLMGEITHAHLLKSSRRSNFIDRAVLTSSMPKVRLANCSKAWRIQKSPPFVELNIMSVAERWQPRRNDNTFQQLTSLYRFILLNVTDPPYMIREYAIRVKIGGARNENLKDLPLEVEATLIGFGEDIISYGNDEPRMGAVSNWNGSRFCTSSDPNPGMRGEPLVDLSRERNEWRSHLLKSLQSALRNVRSYGFDAAKGQWFSNNSQSKREVSQVNEEVAAYKTVNTKNQPPLKPFGF